MKLNWKNILSHAAIIALFLAIAVCYCSPELEGKTLLGHDTESWAYSAKEALDYNETHDEPTLWTNSMFVGMPTYQITMPKNYNVVGYLQEIVRQLPSSIFFVFLYLVCFYIAMLCFGLNKWLSLIGSFALTFASYNFIIIAAGHATKVVAIAYMAPLVGSIYVAFCRNKYAGALLTALFLSLSIRSNHVQILYYTLFVLLAFGISEFICSIKARRLNDFFARLGLLVAAAVLAIGMNATMLLTTYEYSRYTMRGDNNGLTITKAGTQEGLEKDYITSWSYGIDETLTLLIPNFMGGSSVGTLPTDSHTAEALQQHGVRNIEQTMQQFRLPLYWGNQPFTSGPVYFGAIVLLLFVVGMILVEGRTKWWLFAVALLMLMLSWGRNFMWLTELFIDYVPLYNKFRTVSMTLVATGFCVGIIGLKGLQQLCNNAIGTERKEIALLIATCTTASIALLFALFPGIAGNFSGAADAQLQGSNAFLRSCLVEDRMDMLQSDAWRSFLFIAIAAAFLYLTQVVKKLPTKYFYPLFAVLVLADMYPVCRRYFNNDHFTVKNLECLKRPSAADKQILADHSYFRVLDASTDMFNDASPAYFHKNIGGYHAAKLRRYQELIDVHISKEINQLFANATTVSDIEQRLAETNVLNMLNMRYLIYNKEAQPITNPYAFGPAWIVESCKAVSSPDEEMIALASDDLRQVAIVDTSRTPAAPATHYDANATIELKSYEPNKLVYQSSCASPQIAVFSEIYYDKGWNVYIDGAKANYFRANYLLRAMQLPQGEHEIVWKFEPRSFAIGNGIAIACSIAFVLVLIAAAVVYFRKRKA